MPLDLAAVQDSVRTLWAGDALSSLSDYVRIPALSPAYDPGWAAAGHLDAAVEHLRAWAAGRAVELSLEVVRGEGLTPILVGEVPATLGAEDVGTTILYGHFDKQPPMEGWRPELGPWSPDLVGDRLYGRGSADDGYATYAAVGALEALERAGGRHGRCVLLVEGSEESGSPDLPAHTEALAERIGTPELVVCLDSGCATYDRLWATTSLRGLVGATVEVRVLTEGVHSGSAGGLVPSSWRVLRILLDRLEDPATGRILLEALHADIPPARLEEARLRAQVAGDETFPFAPGVRPAMDDPVEGLLARTWRPCLEVTGADGLPPVATAGNVLRPFTTAKLSLRLPPTVAPGPAAAALRAVLTADVPYGAEVTVSGAEAAAGWAAPVESPWLAAALDGASRAWFGQPSGAMGEGGTIPFLAMLAARYPAAQFLVTGTLGPGSNAHGPNEFLHLPMAAAVTGAVAATLDAQVAAT